MFPYTNAIHHPPALLLNVGRVESTGGDYHHYYDGITPGVGRLIDALDRERIAVAAALGVDAVEEMADLIVSSRAFEANLAVVRNARALLDRNHYAPSPICAWPR